MTGNQLRFALVGLGFGRLVIKGYQSAPGAELALLCDLDEKRAAALSREHGIPWTARLEDCFQDGIDAVDVSTPNHLHAGQAEAALAAGKHVLLQKPMCPTAAECARVVAAGRAAGRTVGVYMSSLNQPVIHELRAMLAAGALGTLVSLRGRAAHRSARTKWQEWGRGPDYWRRNKALAGGGAMALIGIHQLHLLTWLAGRELESVAAEAQNVASRDLIEGEDLCMAVGRLRGGGLAAVEASYSSEGNSLELRGTAGSALLVDGQLSVQLDAAWRGRMIELAGGGREAVFSAEELARLGAPLAAECEQHGAFARAVLAGEPPPVPGETGLRDVAVLEAIYRSAASGRREAPAGTADGRR